MLIHILWALPIFIVVVLASIIVVMIPALILRLFGLRKAADACIYWISSLLANFTLGLAGVKVDLTGDVQSIRERNRKGEGFCLVSNHTSMLDIILQLAKLKVKLGFVAKWQLIFVPLINVYIAMTHSLFMNRKSLRKSVESIRKAESRIKKGYCMVVFPEGTRSKTGEIGTFKHGSFRMATESGACIVPITVKGLRDSLEDRKHCFQRRLCHIHVGEPVQAPKATDREAVSQMIAAVEGQIKQTYSTLG